MMKCVIIVGNHLKPVATLCIPYIIMYMICMLIDVLYQTTCLTNFTWNHAFNYYFTRTHPVCMTLRDISYKLDYLLLNNTIISMLWIATSLINYIKGW